MKFLVPRQLLKSSSEDSTKRVMSIDPSQKLISSEHFLVFSEAKDLIKVAQAEAKAIHDQTEAAFEAEKARGYREGVQKAKLEQSEHMIEQISRAVDYFESVEKRMIDLVLASVRKIVYGFEDKDLVVSVVKNALSAVRSQKQVTVRVHPSQTEQVKNMTDKMLSDFPSISFLDVVSDNRVSMNGCLIESDIGLVEINVEEQMEALEEAFSRVLSRRQIKA